MSLSSALCNAICERVEFTGRIIGARVTTKLGVLEESVTDINLIELGLSLPQAIWTKKYSRKEEGSSSGADWLWAFVAAKGDERQILPLLIQAKIVDLKGRVRTHYQRKNKLQLDTLINFGRRIGAIPLIAVYSDGHTLQSPIVLASAKIVKHLMATGQSIDVSSLAPFCFSIESIFCPSKTESTILSVTLLYERLRNRILESVQGQMLVSKFGESLPIAEFGDLNRKARSFFDTENVGAFRACGAVQVVATECSSIEQVIPWINTAHGDKHSTVIGQKRRPWL